MTVFGRFFLACFSLVSDSRFSLVRLSRALLSWLVAHRSRTLSLAASLCRIDAITQIAESEAGVSRLLEDGQVDAKATRSPARDVAAAVDGRHRCVDQRERFTAADGAAVGGGSCAGAAAAAAVVVAAAAAVAAASSSS